MSTVRLPVEIGTIRDLIIVVGSHGLQKEYVLQASTDRFRDTICVGEWDTLEEVLEEFRKWDAIRKEQSQGGDA